MNHDGESKFTTKLNIDGERHIVCRTLTSTNGYESTAFENYISLDLEILVLLFLPHFHLNMGYTVRTEPFGLKNFKVRPTDLSITDPNYQFVGPCLT